MINSSSCLAGVSFSSTALRKHWHIPFVSSFFSLERPLLFPLHLSCVGEAALWYVTRFTPSLIVAWEKVERNSFSLEQVLPWSSHSCGPVTMEGSMYLAASSSSLIWWLVFVCHAVCGTCRQVCWDKLMSLLIRFFLAQTLGESSQLGAVGKLWGFAGHPLRQN